MRWRDYMKFPVAIAAALAALCGYVLWFVNPAATQSTFSGPIATSVVGLPTTSALQIIAANPSRRLIMICNLTQNTTAWIAPLPMVATTNGNVGTTLANNSGQGLATGGSLPLGPLPVGATATNPFAPNCYQTPVLPGSGGGAGAAWNALTSGANPAAPQANLTIWEY